ncbi:hypothetical protein H4582DRAFT_1305131 [Lactarius indigo]|nr:hypothetical protein H4582DRAFT_1305131 [Lactarius indigo]
MLSRKSPMLSFTLAILSIPSGSLMMWRSTASSIQLPVKHGGDGGIPSLTLAIGADEKLIAVYGSRLVNPSPYGDRNIVQLSFVVVNTAGTVPTIQVHTASGIYGAGVGEIRISLADHSGLFIHVPTG